MAFAIDAGLECRITHGGKEQHSPNCRKNTPKKIIQDMMQPPFIQQEFHGHGSHHQTPFVSHILQQMSIETGVA